ncbi:MAG: hypothetical protein NC303_04470 [Firmicutes bacterium]|nr:hypothetical protein [Bacillota bacterium]MCM1393371.1 hypothetical protein [[Eubacterium] siraeum]
MKQKNQQTFFIKEDFTWHYISFYLDSLINNISIDDKEFQSLYKKLQDYIETKVFAFAKGEPIDMYVIIENKTN